MGELQTALGQNMDYRLRYLPCPFLGGEVWSLDPVLEALSKTFLMGYQRSTMAGVGVCIRGSNALWPAPSKLACAFCLTDSVSQKHTRSPFR